MKGKATPNYINSTQIVRFRDKQRLGLRLLPFRNSSCTPSYFFLHPKYKENTQISFIIVTVAIAAVTAKEKQER